ncbi:MAG TPA: hypothetical protein VN982_04920 [Candidatus Dormibacteraeota bacterium]|nr:hypothetical protein [Candidatus Dormibacteraeota bacterium]
MRTHGLAGLLGAVALSLCLGACKDTKTAQENEQLKTQVAELQKENGQLGNELEAMTASRDTLAKENANLKSSEPAGRKSRSKRAVVRKTRRQHHRRRQSVS